MKLEDFFSKINLQQDHLCLIFVNSTSNHQNADDDYLNSYLDFVSWAQGAKLLNPDEALHLAEVVSQQPELAATLHQKTIVLREAIYQILVDVSRDQTPKEADLETLNTALTESMAHMRLAHSHTGFDWLWEGDKSDPEHLIWKVVWSAGELLRSEDLKNVRKCNGCDWLFLDTSRGHRRRWCDMSTCGNRAKARRHYRRTHTE